LIYHSSIINAHFTNIVFASSYTIQCTMQKQYYTLFVSTQTK